MPVRVVGSTPQRARSRFRVLLTDASLLASLFKKGVLSSCAETATGGLGEGDGKLGGSTEVAVSIVVSVVKAGGCNDVEEIAGRLTAPTSDAADGESVIKAGGCNGVGGIANGLASPDADAADGGTDTGISRGR